MQCHSGVCMFNSISWHKCVSLNVYGFASLLLKPSNTVDVAKQHRSESLTRPKCCNY